MKIVAIGGGEIGRPKTEGGFYPIETESIDREIIRLTGKTHPKALFLPTASNDSQGYCSVFEKYYGNKLGCKTDFLPLIGKTYSSEMRDKILGSDLIYVGGGNTLKMLKLWRRLGIDKILDEARKRNIVLSGVSAGAICWFKYGNSDSRKFGAGENKGLMTLRGLDFISLMACPHFDGEATRRPSLRKIIKEHGGMSIALENCSAMEVIDDQYRILTSSKTANAYRLYRKNGQAIEEKILSDGTFRPLADLSKK